MGLEPLEVAMVAAEAAADKKADDIVVLDMRQVTPVTDYFLICSGATSKQVKAIVDGVEEKLGKLDRAAMRREGYREARWVLIDYGDLVVHVFRDDDRNFFALESLWGDADVVALRASG